MPASIMTESGQYIPARVHADDEENVTELHAATGKDDAFHVFLL